MKKRKAMKRWINPITPMTTMFIKDIPRSLADHFWACCRKRGETMKENVLRHMKETIAKENKLQGVPDNRQSIEDLLDACINMTQALQQIAGQKGLIAQHGDALELGIKALKSRGLL